MLFRLNYKTTQTKLRNANLNIRVLSHRYDLQLEPGTLMFRRIPERPEKFMHDQSSDGEELYRQSLRNRKGISKGRAVDLSVFALNFVCSNSTWKDQTLHGDVSPTVRSTAITNTTWQRERPSEFTSSGLQVVAPHTGQSSQLPLDAGDGSAQFLQQLREAP